MHFCHLTPLSCAALVLAATLVLAGAFLYEDTWRRLFNKPKRLVVPIEKDEQEQDL